MNILYIKPTHTTPEVQLNRDDRILNLRGRSSPENSIVFYQRIYDSVDQYFSDNGILTINMMFEYFNTSSSKCLFGLFRQLKKYQQHGRGVVINWFYEEYDDDMLETGEDYADIIDIDINMIEVQDLADEDQR